MVQKRTKGCTAPSATRLSVVGADPLAELRRREEVIAHEVNQLDDKELRRRPLLSANAKTGVSLDFPIGHTCRPTPVCASVCFAARSGAPMTWGKSLRKRLRNLRFFKEATTEEAVDRLTREFTRMRGTWLRRRKVKLNFLRINGSGDLFPELIPVLNEFARRHKEVTIWIVTRQFHLAAQIVTLPNVFLQLSVDVSTPAPLEQIARRLMQRHPRAYLSFLRTTAHDDTRGAAIVFNEKRTEGLPYDRRTDCPVDAGRLELGNIRGVGGTACAKCRKCFTPKVLQRQREDGTDKAAVAMIAVIKVHLKVLGAA